MTRAEALRRLGLDEQASDDEIKRAFRVAVKEAHSDTGGKDHDATVDELVTARAVALKDLSTELVPASQVTDLVHAVSVGQLGARREDRAEKTVRQVVMHHAGRLAHQRRQRLSIAVVTGGLAALVTILEATTKFGVERHYEGRDTETAVTIAIAILGLLAALLGLAGWNASTQEKMLQLEIEGVGETLNDKATLVDTLDEIATTIGADFAGGWTRATLVAAVGAWSGRSAEDEQSSPRLSIVHAFLPARWRHPGAVPLRSTAGVIGPTDFAKLLTAKGLEQGVVMEALVGGDARQVHGFRFA